MKRASIRTATALGLAGALWAGPAAAQDNPVPLNYRNLTVTAFEVNNNQRRNLTGATVTVAPKSGAENQFVTFPLRRTTGTRGATFSKIPPSNDVGPYEVTVVTRDCGEQTKEFRKNGGSDQRLQFTFSRCGQAGAVAAEHERRKAGGNDLLVKLTWNGRPGGGLWVHLKDSDGKEVTKIRTGSGNGEARFRKIPEGSYTLEVKRGAQTLGTYHHEMPDQSSQASFDVS
jgi:hypothetical protein